MSASRRNRPTSCATALTTPLRMSPSCDSRSAPPCRLGNSDSSDLLSGPRPTPNPAAYQLGQDALERNSDVEVARAARIRTPLLGVVVTCVERIAVGVGSRVWRWGPRWRSGRHGASLWERHLLVSKRRSRVGSARMARILMVSKPVAPPWNDSSKNLVRDVSTHLRRHRATVMTARGAVSDIAGVDATGVYASRAGRFSPALADNARVMLRLLTGDRHDLWHFFFAPNPRSSAAGRLASRARAVRTLQTVCSAPAPDADLKRVLFCDRTVVLSRYSERRMLAEGVARGTLHRIPPAVAPLEPLPPADLAPVRDQLGLPRGRAVVVYPGDLEFSGAAERMLRAHAALQGKSDAVLVLACRKKTTAAHAHEARLRELARSLAIADSVLWFGETARIHDLLASADVVALPAETLYAKMDLPLVLIEAMLLARPVILALHTPAAELADGEAAVAVAADADATAAALLRLLDDGVERVALGGRARAAAIARYHPNAVASAYESIYDELLR